MDGKTTAKKEPLPNTINNSVRAKRNKNAKDSYGKTKSSNGQFKPDSIFALDISSIRPVRDPLEIAWLQGDLIEADQILQLYHGIKHHKNFIDKHWPDDTQPWQILRYLISEMNRVKVLDEICISKENDESIFFTEYTEVSYKFDYIAIPISEIDELYTSDQFKDVLCSVIGIMSSKGYMFWTEDFNACTTIEDLSEQPDEELQDRFSDLEIPNIADFVKLQVIDWKIGSKKIKKINNLGTRKQLEKLMCNIKPVNKIDYMIEDVAKSILSSKIPDVKFNISWFCNMPIIDFYNDGRPLTFRDVNLFVWKNNDIIFQEIENCINVVEQNDGYISPSLTIEYHNQGIINCAEKYYEEIIYDLSVIWDKLSKILITNE